MQQQRLVWLDCDPGHDDAMAILLAGYSPDRVKLLGVSTVHGNQSVDKVTLNALACLRAYGMLSSQQQQQQQQQQQRHLVVVKGSSKPLVRPAVHCAEIHGESGLDNREGRPLFPLDDRAGLEAHLDQSGKCVNVMHDHIASAESRVALVATGALTNVALLLLVYPELADRIDVVLMGGAYGLGNTGPVAEFNMQIDPEAARVVFESGASVTMVPLEVTHTALATEEVIARIRKDGACEFRNTLCELLCFFKDTYKAYFGFEDPPLHDPCALAYVIDPGLFETEKIRVDVETGSSLSAGQTICDRHNLQKKPKNATVAYSMRVPEFWDMILSAVDRAVEEVGTRPAASKT
ncbi:inosine-uridine-preferring nucleoside hydrolase [Chloropicon primus]|uniref:Inosine-uridine-preferring nucleoside hydrolase n=1 Tax=Chloropicon primus TaxID=1764295 RepID=A0A5B8MWM9_9CHLO|nr:inosine-uridine-preferring nucleoside hydrolase [Chloropicon primus]|eukprot:QDZ24711.1 inosine-uridine-preferring nucleoside hydrolase [Chloropicon primus]